MAMKKRPTRSRRAGKSLKPASKARTRAFLTAADFKRITAEFARVKDLRLPAAARAKADATAVRTTKSRSTKRARAGAPLAPDTGFDPREPGTTTRLCTPVRNQNTSDLCIAFAVAAAMEAAVCRHRQTTNKAPEINVDHVFRKNGAQVGSVQTIQGAVASGVFDVDCLPFGATQPCTDVAAHTWKCDLRPLQAPKKERVALLKQQLRDVGPLVALIQVFSNFASYDKVEPYVPKKPSAGFHAVCIVGYEVDAGGTTGRWIVKNSLGPGWGDQGFFRLPWGQELVKPEDVVFVAADVHQ